MRVQRFDARIAAGPRGHALIVVPFDPDEEWVFEVAASAGKSRNSPFSGWTLKGRAKAVIVRGGVVFAGEPVGETTALSVAQ